MTDFEKERVYLQLYDYETKEFSGLTTYHGLVRIFNSNTWPSRIFWCIVVLSCLSLFMIHSGYLLLGYHAKPTLFQVNTIVPRNGILFPEVTICNMNSISLRKVKEAKMTLPLLSYVFKFIGDIHNTDTEITAEEDENYKKYIEDYYSRTGNTFNASQFLMSVSKTCEDTFLSCQFAGEDIENCCDHVVTEMTEIGMGFRLSNERGLHRQWYGGDGFGWEIALNGDNEDMENDEDYYTEYGFLVMVHEKNKYPQILSHGSGVSPNSMLHASLAMKNISLLDEQNWGQCKNGWDSPGSKLAYTADHCETKCRLEQVVSLCNCTPLSYIAREGNASLPEVCTPLELQDCFFKMADLNKWETQCDCHSECKLIEYSIRNSYTNLPNWMKFESKEKQQRDISYVSLYFRRIEYEEIEQQKQLQTADLLSNIAGSMGLFLGMSTVTLLEIFIYLFKSVWGTVNSTRQKQFIEAVTEEEKERQQSIVIIQSSGTKDGENNTDAGMSNEDLKRSGNSIHIHLDRRNSRMVRGGDLFSGPRGSVAIPSQLLSPLSKHTRQSISGNLVKEHTAHSQDSYEPPLKRKASVQVGMGPRRNSTIIRPTFERRRESTSSEMDGSIPRSSRKVSTHSLFKSQLI